MPLVEGSRRDALAQLLLRAKRDVLSEWHASRASAVPATRRLANDELRREDSELFDLLIDTVKTGASEGLSRFATTVIERRFQHQFLAEEILAEITLLRRLCEDRIPQGAERAEHVCLLSEVFDSHVQELFRVATEFLLLRVDQRTSQLERFYSFSEVILNTMQDGVIVTDIHGRIIKANRAAQELLHYEEAEILGLAPPYPFCEPWQESCGRSFVDDCLLEGRTVNGMEAVFLSRNKEPLPFHVHAVPVRNHSEEVTGALIVFRDMRETKKLIAELRQSKVSLEERVVQRTRQIEEQRARLERILRNLFDMVFILDLDGVILEANEAAARALGTDPSGLAGRRMSEIAAEGDDSLLEKARRRTVTRNEPITEVQDRLLDASLRPLAVTANFAPVRDTEGVVQGFLCVARDVRERLALELRQSVAGNINRILAGTLDLRTQFDAIATEVRRLFAFDRMSVTVEMPGRGEYELYALAGWSPEHKTSPAGPSPLNGSFIGVVINENRIVRVPDLEESPFSGKKFLSPAGIRSIVGIPLLENGRVFGSLNFGSVRVNDFETLPEDFLREVADQIAVAVTNSRIHGDTAYAAALHAAVFAAITDPVMVTDLSGRIIYANAPAQALSGFKPDEALGRPWIEVTRPFDPEDAQKIHKEILEKGAVVRRRIQGRRKNGEPLLVEFSSGLVLDPQNRPHQIVTIMREIHDETSSDQEHRKAA